MMSRKAWAKDKASFHQFHGQTQDAWPFLVCASPFFFLGSEIMSDDPIFHMFGGGLLSSFLGFIFSCHKLLNINHCDRNAL